MSNTRLIDLRKLRKSALKLSNSQSGVAIGWAMSRLFSSRELQENVINAPEDAPKVLNLNPVHWDELLLHETDDHGHANSLKQQKRWHELRRLLPLTLNKLEKRAEVAFHAFVLDDSDGSPRRPTQDAMCFLEFLKHNDWVETDSIEVRRIRRLSNAA
ncbi:hypothetical protein N9B60_04850 [Mariniblastus sp.]|nr:hypothetical protein [Mariniblastus sp.]MDA7906739.1 hypothetical protein [Mariniblastus sp.]MDA7924711.1 hypothetical protein [Mariniblastus sp.]MDB4545163.1 hypothetical protein [bacterium]